MSNDDCVLIAGAGPVGILTGLYLARAGVPVKLFDELAEIPTDHRAATLQPPTLRMMDDIGMTEKLLAYALGRRIEYYDLPTVRSVVRDAALNEYRPSVIISAIVKSPAFRMRQAIADTPRQRVANVPLP